MQTFTTSTADGVVSDRTVAFDDGKLAALGASETWLLVAGEVGVRCAGYARLTDGVGTGSTRTDGSDPRRAGRTRPADPATSTVASLLVGPVLAMAEETRWTLTVHWRREAVTQL